MSDTMRALPQYQCHKKVWALEIESVDIEHGILHFVDKRYAWAQKDQSWLAKHRPEAGWYWVQYDSGYESASPKEEFEGGYTLIS